ncbi:MAG: O-antigen ligase family protein [Paeniclostridium sordellii]|nr:O-antigen ligase family protein [Paeniclostridium sordellii]
MSKENKIILLLGIINPLLYYISPYLFLIALVFEFTIVIKNSRTLSEKLWKSFMLASMYFGVQMLGLKLYDIVILGFLPIIIIKNWGNILTNSTKRKHIILGCIYLIYLLLVLILNNLELNQVLEFVRYALALLVIISFYLTVNNLKEFESIISILPIYALKNLFSGIIIMLLMMYTNFQDKFSLGLIKINIYNSLPEIRLTGFFSDPNKYFLYFVFLFIIYEFYQYMYRYKTIKVIDKYNLIFILGAISSLSRTGIIAIILYIILKFVNIKLFYDNQKLFLKLFAGGLILLLLICAIFPQVIVAIADKFIYTVTILIGREESLIYSSSLSESSRVMSWRVALNSVSDSPLFGNGLFSWKEFYYMPPHNTFVAIIQDTGFVGLVMFIAFIGFGILNLPINITLILLLIPMMTFDLQNYRLLYLLVAILVTAYSNGEKFNKIK